MTCSTKRQALLIQVLGGTYPEHAVSKMDKESLENFVKLLVKRTTVTVSDDECTFKKPNWWPRNVVFKSRLHFSRDGLLEVRSLLKQLVIKCSEYYKNRSFKQTWLPEVVCDQFYHKGENDENFNLNVINRGEKRKINEVFKVESSKKIKLHKNRSRCDFPIIIINDYFKSKYVPLEPKCKSLPPEPNFVLIPNQSQFLDYFGLQVTNSPQLSSVAAPPHHNLLKLSNCAQVPLSSDIGRVMINNEQHSMPEDIKLRRIEKTEWYLSGKSVIKPTDHEYEVTYTRKNSDEDRHVYKFPKRQFHQEHGSLFTTPFVRKHLESAYVRLERLDLKKIHRKLKVFIPRMDLKQMTPYLCRDLKIVVVKGEIPETETNPIRRYSPRLRSL